MPWSIERRQDEWCVINPDGSSAGCHATRERALRQQRALYAQESSTASVENGAPAVKVELSSDTAARDTALVASMEALTDTLSQVVDALAAVVETQNADRDAFTQALTAAANRPEPEAPVVHVTVPDIILPEQPTINVHVPKTKILIPNAPTPVVNVTMPGTKKTVKFTRNLNGEVEQAEIEEG
jgi:hypothetical protein